MIVDRILGQIAPMNAVAAGVFHARGHDIGDVEDIPVKGNLPLDIEPVEKIIF